MKNKISIMACLFLPVVAVGMVVTVDVSSVNNASDMAAFIQQLPFASTNAESIADIDLYSHEQAILSLLQKDFILTETNALMIIADHLGTGKLLSVEKRNDDLLAAIKHDRFLEFGDSNYVVRAGIVRYGPTSLSCRKQYMYRDRYNVQLMRLRTAIFCGFKRELRRSRWDDYSEEARRILFEEFLRRANATELEIRKLDEGGFSVS